MSPVAMKGKWAQGIRPRNFHWIIKDQIALCERPGGYGSNHRRVRRQEEIIWIREQGFGCVISLIPAPHNLHNYDDLGVTWRHRPFSSSDDPAVYLGGLYPDIKALLRLGVAWNIPIAMDRATADFLLTSPLMYQDYEIILPDYSQYVKRVLKQNQ